MPGKKSLGLSPEEMKQRREMLRRARVQKKREAARESAVSLLVSDIIFQLETGKEKEKIIKSVLNNPKYQIKYNPYVTPLSGVSSGRVKRR